MCVGSCYFFFLVLRLLPGFTHSCSSASSVVYKREFVVCLLDVGSCMLLFVGWSQFFVVCCSLCDDCVSSFVVFRLPFAVGCGSVWRL